jgi:protein-S-isoprenylcysteine O-methyltransferase Ste14
MDDEAGATVRRECHLTSVEGNSMVALIRTLIYVTLVVGLALAFLPASVLEWLGVMRPQAIGITQVVGGVVAFSAGALALWCVAIFGLVGRGTPLPIAPPKRLVTHGPYRYVRNPMALGVGFVLVGAALIYRSPVLLVYTALFFVVIHLFVVQYEEPTLRKTFRNDYEEYCRRVPRWWPRQPTDPSE